MPNQLDAKAIMEMAIEQAKQPTLDELLESLGEDEFRSSPYTYPHPLSPEQKRWLANAEKRAAHIRENVNSIIGNATEIDILVKQFIVCHPDFISFPNDKYMHSSILAMDSIFRWLADRMGGVYVFEEALLRAASVWFAEGKDMEICHYFDYLFSSSLLVSSSNNPDYLRICNLYADWRQMVRANRK